MRAGIKLVVMACTAALMAFSAAALAQEYTRKQWWPSEWGPGDQLGALNRLTPAKVLEATALIRTGTIYDMTFVYEESMPLFDLTPFHRKFTLIVPGGRSSDRRASCWIERWRRRGSFAQTCTSRMR